MRKLAALLVTLLVAHLTYATHLVGGVLYYEDLGGGQFQVTLKMYLDCGPGNTNQTGFDGTASIAAYSANGQLFQSWTVPLGPVADVPIVWNNPCLSPPSTICVQEGSYVQTITLPSGTGGYTLSYQRCCRSPVVINLLNPGDQGLTCTVTIPDTDVSGPNSSPSFDAYPPIALCMGTDMAFSHAATDADGDQLVYDLCAPFVGGTALAPMPVPPNGPPFDPVTWAMGYSVSNMIDASPGLAIDPASGWMSLTPTMIGSFAVGVRVKEFRDGVQLSEVIRDFRFDVVPCQAAVTSAITPQAALNGNTGLCDGLTVDMENQSAGADLYHWDFGVPGTEDDTSALDEPSFTYPAAGTYDVTLIANPGWPCADTSNAIFNVAPPVTVAFVPPPITCVDAQPLTLTATGPFSNNATVTWALGSGTAPDTDAHVTHPTFPGVGTFGVQVTATDFGCTGTFTDSVTLHPRPVPMFSTDTAGCIPLDAQFVNESTAWTPFTSSWSFGDGGTSGENGPLHTYTTAGFHTVSLTVSTSTGCIATETLVRPDLIQVWPQPIARFSVLPLVTDLMAPTVDVLDLSSSAYDVTFEVDGQVFDSTSFSYTFQDAGWYTVSLMATSGLGCTDTTSTDVFVGGHFFFAPNAFTPNGDGMNDTWKPEVKGAHLYRLDIVDRWGRTVFSSTDPKEAWKADGFPDGTYAYKAWLSEWGPLEKEYNGRITLLR
ncbi:MAG: PKD domain-containing protein [Bacteroidetes bacterium]|jgi:gliding motility-associated-like protein|nr:PKD domain-containing protein [Bacteroidota bacterium]MBX7128312.1 PKD domain-containing protein [Flavobacteriales bacterium]MCC6655848.1 PKD domain-containing protein [Flavobacteriales bacterium]HMU13727.1 PKD domain-containing protein [Flavobacteriales bacterium]HNE80368.1 PKD domain-containing protein [Flavobacteriales bacterium]